MDTAEATSATQTQYLTFMLGKETFALEIVRVREVLDFTDATKVPLNPEYLCGVINLRGRVVPVTDLRVKFGMSRTERSTNTCVIITEVEVDGERTVLGALADSVQEVVGLAADSLQPAPKIGTKLNTEFLKGMGKQSGRFLLVLDIDKVFSSDDILLARTAGAAGAKQAD